MLRTLLCASILSLCFPGWGDEGPNATLRLGPLDANGWRPVAGQADTNYQVYTLSASTNLIDWQTIAVTHGESFDFIDPAAASLGRRFYRFSSVPYSSYWMDTNGVFHATNLVKNQLIFPVEPFAIGDFGANEDWVKFLIIMDDPTRVYYTGGGSPYHYDFASTLLEPFIGISPAEFEQISMLNEGRRLLRGTVLFPKFVNVEYGIQFVGTDPLPPQLVLDCFKLVRSTVAARTGRAEAFYIPTYDQYPAALAQASFFATNAIPISSPERWSLWDTAYSGGYALGRLKFVPSGAIANAYASGELRPDDILITDGVPAEVPYLAGIITLTPATANSHVAILAKSYGVPFVYLADEAERNRILQLVDREIVLQAWVSPYGAARVLFAALDPNLPAETRAEILSLREPSVPTFEPLTVPAHYWTNAQSLYPSDIHYFGGKAANYGLLLRVIPSNTPPAIAFSFRLWSEFMNQQLPGGTRLGTEISNRLSGFSYPPNVAVLKNTLAGIRTLIRNGTQFSPALEQVITNALGTFDSRRNIRFRSSTNVEDSENFSGAGLYDSYSGCLDDDRDADSSGPSLCDPTEPEERGVFRAIRRVFSSFYNDNAFMERLRLGVDESTVGMAVLVHHSTPDPLELANGVATATRIPYPSYAAVQGKLVTQYGAVSVANPDGTALPEQYDFEASIGFPNQRYLYFRKPSSLLPLGTTVLETRDYHDLIDLLVTTTDAYATMMRKTNFVLDFEYKKVPPSHLEVKQVREIPQRVEKQVTPFLLNEPTVFETFQGIYGYLWPAHRSKSRWTLETRNLSATSNNLAQGLYTHLTIEHLNGTNVQTLSGPINTFSNFVHRNLREYVSDQFTIDTLIGPADVEVATYVSPNEQLSSEYPFTTTKQMVPYLNVTYRHPVESVEGPFSAEILTIQVLTNATLRLTPKLSEVSRDAFRQFTFQVPGQGTNIFIHTSLWLGAESTHGDRPPLIRFVETRIEGLTTVPIKLTNYWSQTFNATHFPGMMHFLFEPRLDPSVTPAQRAELHAADVAAIYVHGNGYKDHRWEDRPDDPPGCYVLKLVGLDNRIRDFSDCDFGD